jgi:truncated hemoglobin YjbI
MMNKPPAPPSPISLDHHKIKSPSRAELRALIEGVGGTDAFQKILVKFYQRMASDIMIGFFFAGHDTTHIAHQQAKFILNAAGLIDRFEGKGPASAHVSLPPILNGHFDRRLILLRETLADTGISEGWMEKWIQFEESFRAQVVAPLPNS